MNLSIVIHSNTTATVTRTPSWLERWLLGRTESTRAVSGGPLHGWFYDDTDREVEVRISDAIERVLTVRAVRARHERLVRR
jgi:hypothetical protein